MMRACAVTWCFSFTLLQCIFCVFLSIMSSLLVINGYTLLFYYTHFWKTDTRAQKYDLGVLYQRNAAHTTLRSSIFFISRNFHTKSDVSHLNDRAKLSIDSIIHSSSWHKPYDCLLFFSLCRRCFIDLHKQSTHKSSYFEWIETTVVFKFVLSTCLYLCIDHKFTTANMGVDDWTNGKPTTTKTLYTEIQYIRNYSMSVVCVYMLLIKQSHFTLECVYFGGLIHDSNIKTVVKTTQTEIMADSIASNKANKRTPHTETSRKQQNSNTTVNWNNATGKRRTKLPNSTLTTRAKFHW